MPKLELTTTTTLELTPKVKTNLLTTLREYEAVEQAIKVLEMDKAALKVHIEGIATNAGIDHALEGGVEIEGFKVKMVHPTRDTLDVKKLIAQGITTAQIERATVTKPTKSYLAVTPPRQPKKPS